VPHARSHIVGEIGEPEVGVVSCSYLLQGTLARPRLRVRRASGPVRSKDSITSCRQLLDIL
jgi:hypothetical protein